MEEPRVENGLETGMGAFNDSHSIIVVRDDRIRAHFQDGERQRWIDPNYRPTLFARILSEFYAEQGGPSPENVRIAGSLSEAHEAQHVRTNQEFDDELAALRSILTSLGRPSLDLLFHLDELYACLAEIQYLVDMWERGDDPQMVLATYRTLLVMNASVPEAGLPHMACLTHILLAAVTEDGSIDFPTLKTNLGLFRGKLRRIFREVVETFREQAVVLERRKGDPDKWVTYDLVRATYAAKGRSQLPGAKGHIIRGQPVTDLVFDVLRTEEKGVAVVLTFFTHEFRRYKKQVDWWMWNHLPRSGWSFPTASPPFGTTHFAYE
jgi:hypothetical protein